MNLNHFCTKRVLPTAELLAIVILWRELTSKPNLTGTGSQGGHIASYTNLLT